MENGVFFAIFFIFWLGPIIPGVIIAKKKHRSPHWFWLGIWPGVGLWVLVIMLFLKPLKVCPECGKKVQSVVKVCPFCTHPYSDVVKTADQLVLDKKNSRKKTIITVVIVLLIILGAASVVLTSVFSMFTNSEPYTHSITMIENNPEIKAYLGDTFKRTGLISGSITTNGDSSGNASMSYKIKGKNGISRVYVKAIKENGVWEYKKLIFYKQPGTAESIDLLEAKE